MVRGVVKYFARRTCTVVRERAGERGGETESGLRHEPESRPLESFRDEPAYVLLGPPGAGKTTAFKREAKHDGVKCESARDFVTLSSEQEGPRHPVYIDGLDEIPAGSADGRTQFDGIRKRLQALGRPRFRLSCREAAWFGANDRERLKAVAPNGEVRVLRLDPLSDQGVLDILERNLGREDPTGFVDAARRLGVDGLLHNPLNLKMLAAAVVDQEWPRTRTETFDMACRRLVSEENAEHQIAWRGTADTAVLLDSAGDLFAVLLLAGKAGVTFPGTASDADHPQLEHVPGVDQQLLPRVLDTNLFALAAEGRLVPAHRQLAEFLAARRLASLIEGGRPVHRVLSLMTGFDGGIISEFRGLAAWLAAWSKAARSVIIERDPVGALRGDIRDFAPEEKAHMFDCLAREVDQHPWLLRDPSLNPPLGDLAVPQLEDRFRAALAGPPASEAEAAVARLVLGAFGAVGIPPGFDDELLSIVRDSGWPPNIRYESLSLCIRMQDEHVDARLPDALHHVYHREPDAVVRDELSGRLLSELYPAVISVARAAEYLRYPRSNAGCDDYVHFWRDLFVQRSSPDQLLELLGILRKRIDTATDPWRPGPGGSDFPGGLPGRCLKALLKRSPSAMEPSLLYYWIGASSSNPLVGLDTNEVVGWLSSRPGTRRSLVRLAGSDRQRTRAVDVAVIACRAGYEIDRLPDNLNVRFAADPSGPDRAPIDDPAADDGRRHDRRSLDPQFEAGLHDLRAQMRSNLDDMRANRGPAALLHNLAQAYLGRFAELWAPTGRERVSAMLGHHEDLVDCALAALRGAITRADLPTPAELVRLTTEGRLHLLAYPVMAGLRENTAGEHAEPPPLDDRQARLAMTMWHATGEPPRFLWQPPGESLPEDDLGGVPDWVTTLEKARPDLVADVLVAVGRTVLRSGREPRHGYRGLVHPRGSDQPPKLATLRLLEVFPVRCHSRLLPHLRDLLVAACCHCDGPEFVDLVAKKLRFGSMSVGQRVYWLAAGQIIAPAEYSDRLESFVAGTQRRMRHLTTMLVGHGGLPRQLVENWGVPVLAPLIRLLGSFHRRTPEPHPGVAYIVTPDMEAVSLVDHLIDRLAMSPTAASTAALAELCGSESLGHWSDKLSAAAYRQRALHREAGFRHPSVEQVAEVLANRRPASAADLWALVVDLLREFSEKTRDGATSYWRRYWNVDAHNRPENPIPENGCRDALLFRLERDLARLGIDAAREGSYADDKRSDIRVAYGGFNVPVEIKRSCHHAWCSAVRTQLIAKYTRDPGADGYGIYVVFWFGGAEPASGRKPKSPDEMRQAILDTLSATERRKIHVCVIDVSKPA